MEKNQKKKIKEHFGDGSKFGVRLTYLGEKKSLGTGGALRFALPKMGDEPFLLVWSDVLIDIDLGDLIDFHLEESPLMTIALTSVANPTEYGAVRMHRDTMVDFEEKPKNSLSVSRLVSAGVHVVDPKIISYLPKTGKFMLENDVIPKLISKKRIKGYIFEGKWFDVGTPEIYHRAIKEWK